MLVVYRYRVKSKTGLLNKQARAVNFVWNYCNERQKDALRFGRRWHTGFDLIKLATGASKELGLHSGTVSDVCQQYAKSRSQKKRPYLRWRSKKKSLGWVPLKGRNLKETPNGFHFHGREFKVFKSRDLPIGAEIKDGTSFSQDRKGNWFLNVCVEVEACVARSPVRGVGIDLGLKDFATLSTGEKIDAQRLYLGAEQALAVAQRAGKKRRVKSIQARVANRRNDFQHKLAYRLVQEFDYIAVGKVSSAKLAKTSMAKSVLDAGWSSFRNKLAYKAVRHGAWFEEVSEKFSTQTCSDCGLVGGPKGLEGLAIRQWTCLGCEALHDRDVNAARNILSRFRAGCGHAAPAEGIPAL
jgi:IS605 OrfB family transposase